MDSQRVSTERGVDIRSCIPQVYVQTWCPYLAKYIDIIVTLKLNLQWGATKLVTSIAKLTNVQLKQPRLHMLYFRWQRGRLIDYLYNIKWIGNGRCTQVFPAE